MGLFLATISALVFGCADFFGGRAARTSPTASVTYVSQKAGLLVLVVGLFIVPGAGPSVRTIGFGAIGGFFGAVGILLLYKGLSVGTMSIVSPLSAVTSAVVPVVVAMAVFQERPGRTALIGIVSALCAIALVSGASGQSATPMGSTGRSILTAVGAGVGFGLFFVFLQKAGDPVKVGLWGLVGARPVSMGTAALVAKFRGEPRTVAPEHRRMVLLAGTLDQLANVLYVLAIGRGLLAVIGVLSSMFPVSTVALAYFVDRERVSAKQKVGLVFAFCGLILIALPS
jgi:drug/metabolite transporter (DMT)-like permease